MFLCLHAIAQNPRSVPIIRAQEENRRQGLLVGTNPTHLRQNTACDLNM